MRYSFVIHINCQPGQDEAFNSWYDHQHIPDVLDVPGFVAAQRYRAADTQVAPGMPVSHNYYTVYEIETDDLEKTMAEFRSRGGTPKMVMSDAADPSTATMVIYEPVGPYVTSEEAPSRRL